MCWHLLHLPNISGNDPGSGSKILNLNRDPFFESMILSVIDTVKSEIKAAPQKNVIPKDKELLCLFSFGTTILWGAAFTYFGFYGTYLFSGS